MQFVSVLSFSENLFHTLSISIGSLHKAQTHTYFMRFVWISHLQKSSQISNRVTGTGWNGEDLNEIDWLYEFEHDWIDTEIRSIICNLISDKFCNQIGYDAVYSMSKLIGDRVELFMCMHKSMILSRTIINSFRINAPIIFIGHFHSDDVVMLLYIKFAPNGIRWIDVWSEQLPISYIFSFATAHSRSAIGLREVRLMYNFRSRTIRSTVKTFHIISSAETKRKSLALIGAN